MSSLNKIHVNSSTALSLNDRFTAMAENRKISRTQNRNNQPRNIVPDVQPANPHVASANRRLLVQLERRHKMLAAMRVKRRNLRAPVAALKRGSVKALRVGANGKPIKTNTLTKIATMNADFVTNGKRNRSLRRANSMTPVANRLGIRSGRSIGGAAERVAKRKIARLRLQLKRNGVGYDAPVNRRSRSRIRVPMESNVTGETRGRSMSRGRSQSRGRQQSRGLQQSRGRQPSRDRLQGRGRPPIRGRSQSRSRPLANPNVRRGRSASRNRAQKAANGKALSIKDRLGVRPGTFTGPARRNRSVNGQRNIIQGRVQKRSGNVQNGQNKNGAGGRMISARGRPRSQSSGTRKGLKQQLQQGSSARNARVGRRGRNQIRQRGFGNGNTNGMKKGQQQSQPQQRRGRSRSRVGDSRNIGKNVKQSANKDQLDKELDQYMATTRTENDMGYLLRN